MRVYDLAAPPRPKLTATQHAESAEFVAQIQSVARTGGGVLTAPEMELRDLPAFWNAVVERLPPPEWTLTASGARDAGASRLLVPFRADATA